MNGAHANLPVDESISSSFLTHLVSGTFALFLPILETRVITKMRDRINALYYPEFTLDTATLKRSILLFDELHIMDRPSFSFGGPKTSNFGMIGAASPLRQFEQSFREEGMPLYVHGAPGGRMCEEDYAELSADLNDIEYLRRFQQGMAKSEAFRLLQIPVGNYGAVGNQDDVVRCALDIELSTAFLEHGTPIALLEDRAIPLFDYSTPLGRAKSFVNNALTCSTKLNLALRISAKYGHQPLADATPYGELLGVKYARAIKAAESVSPAIQLTDITFAVIDELLPLERLNKLSMKDLLRYRKQSADSREHFLEHMAAIHTKLGEVDETGDYQAAINKIMVTEIRPAARDFQNSLAKIDDGFVAAIEKGGFAALGGSSLVQLFGALSWTTILSLAAAGAAFVGSAALDAYFADRAARRGSSVSYILSLD